MSLRNCRDFKNKFIFFLERKNSKIDKENDKINIELYQRYLENNTIRDLIKQNDNILQLLLLKPEILMIVTEKLKSISNLDDRKLIEYFLKYLKRSEKFLKFLVEYSYSYSENDLLKYLREGGEIGEHKSIISYIFKKGRLNEDERLYRIINFSDLKHEFYKTIINTGHFDSNSRGHHSSSSFDSSGSSGSSGEKQFESKKNKKNTNNTKNNSSKENRNKKKSAKNKVPQYYNRLTKKLRDLDSSYYTEKYKQLFNSYPKNNSFSKCQRVAPDSYRKYRCNFFYDKCPQGWVTDRVGNISKCKCTDSSIEYYNDIFDCNPYLGLVGSSSKTEKECGTVEKQEDFRICFNKTYEKVNQLHQKNKQYWESMTQTSDLRKKSELNIQISVNEETIKKLARELKEKFPNRDFSNYMYFSDFIDGYLRDPLNFIEPSPNKSEINTTSKSKKNNTKKSSNSKTNPKNSKKKTSNSNTKPKNSKKTSNSKKSSNKKTKTRRK